MRMKTYDFDVILKDVSEVTDESGGCTVRGRLRRWDASLLQRHGLDSFRPGSVVAGRSHSYRGRAGSVGGVPCVQDRVGRELRGVPEGVVAESQVLVLYPDRILRRWATISDEARRNGRSMSPADAWIAATALALGLPVVTHNPGDYRGVAGLTVLTAGNA